MHASPKGSLARADIRPWKPAPVAPAERPDEAAELLDELLSALLEQPADGWFKVAEMLSAEVLDKLCDRIEANTG